MDKKVFKLFRDIIYDSCGIALSDDKIHLLSNRIFKRMRRLGIADPAAYLAIVKNDESGKELIQLINAISTNVTHFFREPEHFHRLTQICKDYDKVAKDKIRIWCAASSTGEKPYTIAMTYAEALNLENIDFKILATDINVEVLKHAKRGYYLQNQVGKIPDHLDRNIFCRNVIIYFDLETRAKVINEMYRVFAPGGYLILNRSENLLGLKHPFQPLSESVYRKGY
ncbi:MAG: chemotaxis protein CheR [Deltaproteobacteria bacterium]|nr:chemotaxis protein CheR [Deltaproteobacteria bacterium]